MKPLFGRHMCIFEVDIKVEPNYVFCENMHWINRSQSFGRCSERPNEISSSITLSSSCIIREKFGPSTRYIVYDIRQTKSIIKDKMPVCEFVCVRNGMRLYVLALKCDSFAYSFIIFFADSAACGTNCGRVLVLMCLLALATVQSAIWKRKVRKFRVFCYNRSCWSVVLQS